MKKVCKKWNIAIMIFCLVFTMMPLTAFADKPVQEGSTSITFLYWADNQGGDDVLIEIDHTNLPLINENSFQLIIPDTAFSEKIKIPNYSVEAYIPDTIYATNGEIWTLTENGNRQVEITKGGSKTLDYHYKVVDTENPPETVTPGCITITKLIDGDEPDTDATFTFEISGPSGFSTTASITYDASATKSYTETSEIIVEDTVTIENLSPGPYTVTEEDNNEDYTVPKGQNDDVVSEETTEFTFINNYEKPVTPPEPVSPGCITITKLIDGDEPDADATFTFEISCPSGFTTTASITYDASVAKSYTETSEIIVGNTTVENLTPGAYTVTEEDNNEDYTVPVGQNDDVVSEETTEFTFINNYEEPVIPPEPATPGCITITKLIDGDEPDADATFTFEISGPDGFTTTATIDYDASVTKSYTETSEIIVGNTTVENLTPGAYTVTEEENNDGYTVPEGQNDDVVSEETTEFTFTNIYKEQIPDYGAYVTKKVAEYDGVNLPADEDFKDKLTLNKLNRSVIFKITLSCNEKWVQREELVGLLDLYDDVNITDELYVLEDGDLVKVEYVPHSIFLREGVDTVFYYKDTLTEYGTYTNTASIFRYLSEIVHETISSSSATVEVKEPEDKPTPDNPPHHHDHDNGTTEIVPQADTSGGAVIVPEAVPVTELDAVPKTGDEAPIMPFMILGALSAAILAFFGRKRWLGSESK